MPTKKQDEIFASHLPGVLRYHAKMLSDGVRNRLLLKAIKRSVTRESQFLDVGAGSGVWAIIAAKLGARRVVAVEIEEALIPVIHRHAEENGVADKIEIIHGNIDDVDTDLKFDVIVCELFGSDAFGKSTLNSFIRLRDRFLEKGGVLIPERLEMWAVPIANKNGARRFPADLPISAEFLRTLHLNYPGEIHIAERDEVRFLAPAEKLVGVDFRKIENPLETAEFAVEWSLKDLSKVEAIGVFQRSVFDVGLELDSRKSKSWNFTRYSLEPFLVGKGTLRFSLNLDPKNGSVQITVPSHSNIAPQTYSPVFGFTRTKMAQAVTPFKRFRSKKKNTKI